MPVCMHPSSTIVCHRLPSPAIVCSLRHHLTYGPLFQRAGGRRIAGAASAETMDSRVARWTTRQSRPVDGADRAVPRRPPAGRAAAAGVLPAAAAAAAPGPVGVAPLEGRRAPPAAPSTGAGPEHHRLQLHERYAAPPTAPDACSESLALQPWFLR